MAALSLAALLGLLFAISSFATGPVGTASGFEDDDGNLVDDSGSADNGAIIDWNSFAPTTWTGTAPYRESDKGPSAATFGWTFKGIEDAQATNTDTAFAGGVKQDDDCATVNTGKAPNKDDLKRIYLSTKVVGGDTYLNLAWVRIPQNTTSASAHVAFEFNKGDTPCSSTSPLVQRTAGDMLIVYDFEGGSGAVPTLTLRRWVTSGTCEISSDSAPCWGTAQNLTAGGFAEAKVNTGNVTDGIAPSPPETLGTGTFGEAGINLTDAGVFTPGSCESFGTAFGVSRSSGNSGTAQMKDLVGPADFTIANCGEIKIIKRTFPRGVNQDFGFTSTITGSELTCTADATPASFTLNDSAGVDNSTNTEDCTNVPVGSYTVTEGSDPSGFAFTDLSCTASGTGTSATPASGSSTKTASITMAAGGLVTCVYTNTQQLGAIKITKTSSKDDSALEGAQFSITKGVDENGDPIPIDGSPFTTDSNGEICVDNLPFGNDYKVTETAAPTGYAIDDNTTHTVTVDTNAACDDATYVGEGPFSFSDTPLADIQVRFRDGGSGATALVQPISCDNATGTSSTADTTGWDDTLTVTGIKVGAEVTVTCTIKIDP